MYALAGTSWPFPSRVAFYYDADEYDVAPTDAMLLEYSSVVEVAECGLTSMPPSSAAPKNRAVRARSSSRARQIAGGASILKPLDFITNYITSGALSAPGAVVSVTSQTITLQPQRVRRVSRFGLLGTTTFWLLFGRETKSFFFTSPERCARISKLHSDRALRFLVSLSRGWLSFVIAQRLQVARRSGRRRR